MVPTTEVFFIVNVLEKKDFESEDAFFSPQDYINPRRDYKDIIITWCSDLKLLFHFSYGQASINIRSSEWILHTEK